MEQLLHIVLFKGRLVTLDFFVECFAKYLKKQGIDYYLVDTNIPETYNSSAFDNFIKQPCCVMFTFNNIGVKMDEAGKNIWKSHGIPVYSFIVDPPRAFSDILLHPPCDMYVFSLDENRNDFIREFYPEIKEVYFMAAAGQDVCSGKPLKDRSIDVIYMGCCQKKVDSYPVLSFFEDEGVDFYQKVISGLIENSEDTTEQAIRKYLDSCGLNLTHDQLREVIILTAGPIEATVRRTFKQAGMQALDRHGIKVDIWGTGWEDDEYTYSDNIHIHSRVTPEELLHYTGDSKISLVYMGWQKRGCSEKNFDSMLNGCACVSDPSSYLLENYVDGKNIVYFDMHNPEQMALDVQYLLDHPDVAQNIADEGYKTASKYDSWDVRSKAICEIITRNYSK